MLQAENASYVYYFIMGTLFSTAVPVSVRTIIAFNLQNVGNYDTTGALNPNVQFPATLNPPTSF